MTRATLDLAVAGPGTSIASNSDRMPHTRSTPTVVRTRRWRVRIAPRRPIVVILAVLTLLLRGKAIASTATTTLAVSATVLSICTVTSTPIAFGNYTGALINASGTVLLTCTIGTAATIGLDTGANGAHASGTTRAMAVSGNYLSYEIYQDSGHTTVWTNSGGGAESTTGTGVVQTLTAQGQLPANQLTVPVGAYVDTVNVTVTY